MWEQAMIVPALWMPEELRSQKQGIGLPSIGKIHERYSYNYSLIFNE